MSIEKKTCFIVLCDGCADLCWSEMGPLHYSTVEDALRGLAADDGWRITDYPGGRTIMLCSECAARQDCAATGHTWKVAEMAPGLLGPPRVNPIELCTHCHTVRRDDAPVGDHPESMASGLSPEEEAWLSEADRDFAEGAS